MRSKKNAIDMLFPSVRAELLRLFFKLRRHPLHVRDIARRAELAVSTVHEELHNLKELGVITSSSNGYQRFYSANPQHVLFQSLSKLVQLSDRSPVQGRAKAYRSVDRRRKRVPQTSRLAPDRPLNWGIFRHH